MTRHITSILRRKVFVVTLRGNNDDTIIHVNPRQVDVNLRGLFFLVKLEFSCSVCWEHHGSFAMSTVNA